MKPDVATFSLGQIVYHKVDEGAGIVVGICFRDTGVSYQVVWSGRIEGWHGAIELSTEPVFNGAGSGEETA